MAMPAVTDPPGELMYKLMALSGLSLSKNNNCAQIKLAVCWPTSPSNMITRSLSKRL
jgi:hypothetical protein